MSDEENDLVKDNEPDEDPSVPSDLLELHVELEASSVSPEAFKEVFGGTTDPQE